jgi:hypothetical protein
MTLRGVGRTSDGGSPRLGICLPNCERLWIRVEPGDFALARDGVTKSPVPRPSAAGSEPVHTLPFPTPERENVREVSRPQTGGCSKLLTL